VVHYLLTNVKVISYSRCDWSGSDSPLRTNAPPPQNVPLKASSVCLIHLISRQYLLENNTNFDRPHEPSSCTGHQDTWTVWSHRPSGYIGHQVTWVIRLHGPSTCAVKIHGLSGQMGHQIVWAVTSIWWSSHMGHQITWAIMSDGPSGHSDHPLAPSGHLGCQVALAIR